jgi:hypothetical protein
MTCTLTSYDNQGRKLCTLGQFGNLASARQAMLDNSNTIDLPSEDPWFGPDIGVIEGWFVGTSEYLIETVGR